VEVTTLGSKNISSVEFKVSGDWQTKMVPGIIKTLEKTGDKMVEEAQAIVAFGSGTLHDSIYRKVVQDRNSKGQFGWPVLIFGASAPYASAVEFGHHTVSGGWVEAQPFLRPVGLKHRSLR
jgi:hypothetical protein